MIRKIVSGGQTGADQGALDAAIKLGLAHGGWVPKGRKTEKGRLPDHYDMQELPSTGYPERTEKNVVDSDGTVILSHGRLSGGSEFTRKMALKHGRPWIHIDLNQTSRFEAATVLSKWASGRNIRVLNVAGPRASRDPEIYGAAMGIIESAFFLMQINDNTAQRLRPPPPAEAQPKTVEDAVVRLVGKLSLKDKTTIANMAELELGSLEGSLGDYIRSAFGLGLENDELTASCRFVAKGKIADDRDAARVIIRALWKELRRTHKLRVVR